MGPRSKEPHDCDLGGHHDAAINHTACRCGQASREGRGYGPILFASILLIIAMDVVARYGLCAYASRANLEAG